MSAFFIKLIKLTVVIQMRGVEDSKLFCGLLKPSKCVGFNRQTGRDAGLAKKTAWKPEAGCRRLEGESSTPQY